MELDNFTRGYIECALWSSTDDDQVPLDSNYGLEDLALETLEKIIADCKAFQAANEDDLTAAVLSYKNVINGIRAWAHAGHDFWLTRNGHGSGFWDGDLPEPLGERLTKASKTFGECSLYVGDDRKLYLA